MKEKKLVFITFIGAIIIVFFLCIFGIYNNKLIVEGHKDGNRVSDIKDTEIMLEGTPLTIRTRTYESDEGYKVDYDIDNFDYIYKNEELRFVFKENNSIYLGIKRVNDRGSDSGDTRYISKNGIILRVRTVSSNTSSEESEGVLSRLSYIADSIEITK